MVRVLSGILGALIIVGGIYCLMAPAATFLTLVWIIGLVMIVDGISNIVAWSSSRKVSGSGWLLAGAIISILFGIILLGSFLTQFIVGVFLVYMIAAWFIVSGIMRIVAAFNLRKIQKAPKKRNQEGMSMGLSWGWMLAFGILLTIFGILSFCSPIFLAAFIGTIVGIAVIVAGVNLFGFAITGNQK